MAAIRRRNVFRLSIALDPETERMVGYLSKEEGRNASETIRMAIKTYFDLKKDNRSLDIEKLKKFGEMLESEEHVLVDIDLWIKILDELNKKGSEEFFRNVREIGYNKGIQYKKIGLKDIHETLKTLEIGNWFKLKANGDEAFTVVLSTRSEQNLLKSFLEGMFEAQGIQAEIIPGFKKLTVVKKSSK
ncbi:MAG: CopG family transcriptional regulator [Archaeoglobus sp.]|nr:CopG family transcriptional regulator [Archaeoglobus sp.]